LAKLFYKKYTAAIGKDPGQTFLTETIALHGPTCLIDQRVEFLVGPEIISRMFTELHANPHSKNNNPYQHFTNDAGGFFRESKHANNPHYTQYQNQIHDPNHADILSSLVVVQNILGCHLKIIVACFPQFAY
jgi:hypothetical protein